MGNQELAEKLVQDILDATDSEDLTTREKAICGYAKTLTKSPGKVQQTDIELLRAVGLDDATILDLNQVVAYFAYANRTASGLGIELE